MLAIMVPEGIRTKDTIFTSTDTDALKYPLHWVNAKQGLVNPLNCNAMAESTKHMPMAELPLIIPIRHILSTS